MRNYIRLMVLLFLIPFCITKASTKVYVHNVDNSYNDLGGTLSIYEDDGITPVETEIESGDYDYLTTSEDYQALTDEQVLSTRMHHDWNANLLDSKIRHDFSTVGATQNEYAVFYSYTNVSFNLSSNVDNPEDWLELRDPWWVENPGTVYQPNDFRTISDMGISSTHKMFAGQSISSNNEYYSIKAPQIVADTDGIYQFSSLSATGATLSPDPDHPSDSRYKAMVVISSTVNITATYTQINTSTSTYTVPSSDKFVIPADADIACASGTYGGFKLLIEGDIEVIGTADEPITLRPATSSQYWSGIEFGDTEINAEFENVIFNNVFDRGIDLGVNAIETDIAFTNCVFDNADLSYTWRAGTEWGIELSIDISNCTFYNSVLALGYTFEVDDDPNYPDLSNYDLTLRNNIFYGEYVWAEVGNLDEDYCDYYDNYVYLSLGNNSITSDPDFNDAANGDFTLDTDSPCIDAGDPSTSDDPDGTTADMGAYYCDYPPSAPTSLSYTTNAYDNPVLSWTASTDPDISLYKIYRGSDDHRIAMTQIATTTSTTYTDATFWIAPLEDYQYYVKAQDNIGQVSSASNEIDIGGYAAKQLVAQLPKSFSVHDNFPNPFNPTTTINYDLPEQSLVTMTIYDYLGRKVKTLVNDEIDAGYKSAVWNGRNDFGKAVASGIYLLTVDIKGADSGAHHSYKMKLILIK